MSVNKRSRQVLGRRNLAPLLSVGLLAATFLPATAQEVHPVTGRRIAPVMGYGGSAWLERPERVQEEAPDAALEAIGIGPGMVVADIGAGSGYFTRKLARRVAPAGKVYANDIQPEMLELCKKNVAAAGLRNVEFVLGTVADPKLPAGTLDLVLLVDVYHEFSEPQKMLQQIRRALKSDGRLVLLEYKKEVPNIPIREEHKMSVTEVKAELAAEGYRLDKLIDTLPRQHILIFVKNSM